MHFLKYRWDYDAGKKNYNLFIFEWFIFAPTEAFLEDSKKQNFI